MRARMSARDKNRETQPAAPPLPPLSIPGHVFCRPGQIRWFLGRTPALGQKPRSPGRAPDLAALHRPSCTARRRRGNPGTGELCRRSVVSRGMAQFGAFHGEEPRWPGAFLGLCCRQGHPERGNNPGAWDGDGDTLRRGGRGKIRAKRSLWAGRFAFEGSQQ